MRCSELRATNCSRPFVFASTRLPICWNTVQAPVPRRQSQSAECLLGLSFLLSFLPSFLLSHFFPQSSCEEERVVYLSRVRVPTVALPPRFPHSSLPNSSIQPIHRLEFSAPQASNRPFTCLLCPPHPLFLPTNSLASLICLCINLLTHKLFY